MKSFTNFVFYIIIIGVISSCCSTKKVDVELREYQISRFYIEGALDFELVEVVSTTYKKDKLSVKSKLKEVVTGESLKEAFFVVRNGTVQDSIYANANADVDGVFEVDVKFNIDTDTLVVGQLGMVDRYYGVVKK